MLNHVIDKSESEPTNNGLPQSWSWTTIEAIYDVIGGGTPSTEVTHYWNGDIPWITSADIHGLEDIRPRKSITKQAIVESATNLVPPGTIIVVTRVSLGKLALTKEWLCFSQDSQALVERTGVVEPKFALYYLSQAVQEFKHQSRGTTISGVTKKQLRSLSFPLAPLAEQKRIVDVIEAQFTRLDAAVAGLRRLRANLQRYRQSVLKAACEGRLVPTEAERARAEDRPFEDGATLLQRVLAERRRQWEADNRPPQPKDDKWKAKYREPAAPDVSSLPDLPDGWVWASLDQATECLDRLRVPINKKERAEREGDYPYYGANGQVGWIDDYLFDEPLVLVVEDETFTGRQKPFSYKIKGKTWVNNHAHVLRPSIGVDVDYLNYSLAYYPFTPLTTGTTGRKKLTQAALLFAPYALPPLAEQERIVEEVERRLSVIEQHEQVIAASLKRAERLRQSILKRAFAGQLVAQDPNDEPAWVLLGGVQNGESK